MDDKSSLKPSRRVAPIAPADALADDLDQDESYDSPLELTVADAHTHFGNSAVFDALSGQAHDPLSTFIGGQISGAMAGMDFAPEGNQAMLKAMRDSQEPQATDALAQVQGQAGQPLPNAVRQRFETAFDHDFSHVRIHTGSQASQASEQVGAHAFALGEHLFFNASNYAPGTADGDRLLLHELTHVVQHDEGRLPTGGGVSSPTDSTEQEAYGNERLLASSLPSAAELSHDTHSIGADSEMAASSDVAADSTTSDGAQAQAPIQRDMSAAEEQDSANKIRGRLAKFAERADDYLKTMFAAAITEITDGLQQAVNFPGVGNGDWVAKSFRALMRGVGKAMQTHDAVQGTKEQAEALAAKLQRIGTGDLSPAEKSWLTAEEQQQVKTAREQNAGALDTETASINTLEQALAAFDALIVAPTPENTQTANDASSSYTPSVATDDQAAQVDDKLDAADKASEGGIKKAIKALVDAAGLDDTKKLAMDKNQWSNFYTSVKTKTKAEVEVELQKKVDDQHSPKQSQWRNFLRLPVSKTNLYMRSLNKVGGYDAHVSLFHNTINADTNVATSSASAIKLAILGTGTGGFHVTIERFDHTGPLKNPHSYRGGDLRQNDFAPDDGGKDWNTVRPLLVAQRVSEVNTAEATIDKVKTSLGGPVD